MKRPGGPKVVGCTKAFVKSGGGFLAPGHLIWRSRRE